MTLPPLDNWIDTYHTISLISHLLGDVRAALADEEPHGAHYGLSIYPKGLTTNNLLLFGEVRFDLSTQTIQYVPEMTEPVDIPIEGHSQESLAKALIDAANNDGADLPLHLDYLSDATVFSYHPEHMQEFHTTLSHIFDAFREVQMGIVSNMTPLLLWPGSLELTFTVFPTPDSTEEAPHIKFGFLPAQEDFYDRPFIYAFSDPTPDAIFSVTLPEPAYWYTDSWAGLMLVYDDIVNSNAPKETIRPALTAYYQLAAPYIT